MRHGVEVKTYGMILPVCFQKASEWLTWSYPSWNSLPFLYELLYVVRKIIAVVLARLTLGDKPNRLAEQFGIDRSTIIKYTRIICNILLTERKTVWQTDPNTKWWFIVNQAVYHLLYFSRPVLDNFEYLYMCLMVLN